MAEVTCRSASFRKVTTPFLMSNISMPVKCMDALKRITLFLFGCFSFRLTFLEFLQELLVVIIIVTIGRKHIFMQLFLCFATFSADSSKGSREILASISPVEE